MTIEKDETTAMKKEQEWSKKKTIEILIILSVVIIVLFLWGICSICSNKKPSPNKDSGAEKTTEKTTLVPNDSGGQNQPVAKPDTVILARPGQIIWEKTLTDSNRIYDSISVVVGTGVFIHNFGPGKIKSYWAEYDIDIEPGENCGFNFTKYRPGAKIRFQLIQGDSARVQVKG